MHVATPFDEERLLVVRHEELDLDNMCIEHVVEDDDWGVYY